MAASSASLGRSAPLVSSRNRGAVPGSGSSARTGSPGGAGSAVLASGRREGRDGLERGDGEPGRRGDPGRGRRGGGELRQRGHRARGRRAIVKAAVDAFGRVDVLVNNAGILRDKSLLKMDEAMWDVVIAVHLKGTFLCSQAFAKQMVAQGGGGRIVNTTSVSGMLGNFGQANYSAAKAGIYGLTRTTAIELQKQRITVNAIAPIAKTRMTEDLPMFQRARSRSRPSTSRPRRSSSERPLRRPHRPRPRRRRRADLRVQGGGEPRAVQGRARARGPRRRSPTTGTRSSRCDHEGGANAFFGGTRTGGVLGVPHRRLPSNTTRSISEFEPSRFAPCTDTQAASPSAIRPGHDGVVVAVLLGQDLAVIWSGCHPCCSARSAAPGSARASRRRRRRCAPIRRCRAAVRANTFGSRWSRCRRRWSFFGPTPRPSRISIVIARETTSREARSLARGRVALHEALAIGVGEIAALRRASPR